MSNIKPKVDKPRTTQRHSLTRLQNLRQQARLIIEIRNPVTRPVRTHHSGIRIRLIAITSSQSNSFPPRRTVQTGGVIVTHGSNPIRTVPGRSGSDSRRRCTFWPSGSFALHLVRQVGEIVVDSSHVEVGCPGAARCRCERCC